MSKKHLREQIRVYASQRDVAQADATRERVARQIVDRAILEQNKVIGKMKHDMKQVLREFRGDTHKPDVLRIVALLGKWV